MKSTRTPVKRPSAEAFILISLTCFGLTVAVTRVYLELAGYPQIGNSVLHIAHALWGGLLLLLAALLPLILMNRWAFTLSAVLSGIGVGLFIDEVGKFITQKNDYTAIFAALLSFTAVNLLNFYLNQFGALAAFFFNLAVFFVLLAYRSWYLTPRNPDA
jgi:hypothetical protein